MICNFALQEVRHVDLGIGRLREQVSALEDLWAKTEDVVYNKDRSGGVDRASFV